MSAISLIAELLEEESVLPAEERALGIWEIIKTFCQPIYICAECGLAGPVYPSCGHMTSFFKYYMFDPTEILGETKELPDKNTYTQDLKALFTKQRPENRSRDTFR